MAIAFARARYVSRASGGNAVRSAAYNGRERIEAERTGEVFHFKHRDAPEHHEVLLPPGAAARFADSAVLWNAAEAAERRKDAQVARELVLALPANAGITGEDRIALARSFAEAHFVKNGLVVQLDVHAPHGAEAESERANWHAHLLVTTRRIEGDAFSAKKARDLDPEVRSAGGKARVADGVAWGELWREHQERYFREHGLDARVDATAAHAQEHIGPVRMRRAGSEIAERAEAIRQANQEAARDPAQVLAALTRNNATFTGRDVERYLAKHIEGADERAAITAKLFGRQDVVALHDRETGELTGRFTARQVREEEWDAMAAAAGLSRQKSGAVSDRSAEAATAARTLRPDQQAAFAHATGVGGLKLIEGRAGTGKSYTLAAIRDAHARDGKRVVGLAPTNAVAQDMAADGFAESGTVHSALFRLKNGRTSWDRNTVVVVDEAAMLDTRVTGDLLAAARQAGAKVILAGDDRQLASIERGGLFAELRRRHGSAAIVEVTRQRVDWQRQAARDLAEGRFAEAVGAFDKAGAITWTDKQEEARSALVAAWKRDGEAQLGQSRFVFAYTNRDVDALNAELREVRRERGELAGADVALETRHGPAAFAVGDRVQFTDTDKKRRIYNGNVGTITGLDARAGQITARLDAASGAGREVTWTAAEFAGFRHGYAGTIYKGQGKTLDRSYLYHTEHWRSAASYVALTRQRESAEVFVARETARDAGQLARQMARGEVRSASIAWATPEELARARPERQAGREQPQPARAAAPQGAAEADPAEAYWPSTAASPEGTGQEPRQARRGRVAASEGKARDGDRLRAKVRDRLAARQEQDAKAGDPEAALSPDARLVLRAMAAKIDRDFSGAEDRAELKAHAARQLAAKEGEGPIELTDAQRRLMGDPFSEREQLRLGLHALDRGALAEQARADQVGFTFSVRPMTVQDAARLVSRDYAAAADRAAGLRKAAAEVDGSINHHEQVQRAEQEGGDRRWREMGWLRQALHKSGAKVDQKLLLWETRERLAVGELVKLDARKAELARQVPQAESVEAAAFRQAEPAATAELAKRQERAGLAREVLAERRQQEAARERQVERSRGHERGMGR